MTTKVDNLKHFGLSYNDHQNFTEMILSETLDYLTDLASVLRKLDEGDTTTELTEYIASLPSHLSVEAALESKVKSYLNKVAYCLKLDTENNVIENCFFYGRFNAIAEAFLRDGVKGVREHFHPPVAKRTPEEEAKYQQGINDLLGFHTHEV